MLLRKPRAYAEVYNDLDGEIVNLFVQARENGEALAKLVELTPFARSEFAESYSSSSEPLEQARRTLIRSFMGFGSNAHNKATGFRANSNHSGTPPAHDWMNYPDALRITIQRLRGIVIENRDALKCMQQHDGLETLHYVDPPYVMSTRSDKHSDYSHEMTDEDHQVLATGLKELGGMVIVSGYRSALYDSLYGGWKRIDRAAHADGAAKRIESLWLSPNIKAPGFDFMEPS